MAKIYESVMSLIKPGRIAAAAAALGETDQKVSSSVDIIVPSLLARALKKGNTPQIRAIAEEAGKLRMHDDYNKIWDGNAIFDGKNMGVRMENQLLGTDNNRFYQAVSSKTGIGRDNANRLTTWAAGTVAAYFGDKIAGGMSYADILADIEKEKDELRKDIPSDIISILGLETVLGSKSGATAAKKKNYSWIWWVLAAIVVILIIFFWARSCSRDKDTEVVKATVVEQTATPATTATKSNEAIPEPVSAVLPDGQKVSVYKDAGPAYIEAFLKSDKFKNATEAQLKTVWFEMPGIDYEHNSSTEFMAGGEKQIKSLADMLKKFPDVKIKIGAFADATGSRAVNYEISRKRAENIKRAFEQAGIDKSRVTVEGFGEEYAKKPADASDAARAMDRDIALRFTK